MRPLGPGDTQFRITRTKAVELICGSDTISMSACPLLMQLRRTPAQMRDVLMQHVLVAAGGFRPPPPGAPRPGFGPPGGAVRAGSGGFGGPPPVPGAMPDGLGAAAGGLPGPPGYYGQPPQQSPAAGGPPPPPFGASARPPPFGAPSPRPPGVHSAGEPLVQTMRLQVPASGGSMALAGLWSQSDVLPATMWSVKEVWVLQGLNPQRVIAGFGAPPPGGFGAPRPPAAGGFGSPGGFGAAPGYDAAVRLPGRPA